MNRKLCLFVLLASLVPTAPVLAEGPPTSGRSTAESAPAKKKIAGRTGKKRAKKLRRKPGPAPGSAVAPNPNAPLSIEDAIADQIGAAAARSARSNRGSRRTSSGAPDDTLRDATMGTNRLPMTQQNNPIPVEPPAANNNNMNN